MTRCNYIPSDGLSVIALAKERGGTTDGDIAALVDRFGCKADAAYEMTAEEDADREQFSCIDHVGHLCGDGHWIVEPVYRPSGDVAISIVNTQGIARAGFGSPMILAPVPTTTPIVDLGTNPTREQVRAAGFDDESEEYRKARGAFARRPPNSTGFDPDLVSDATAAGGYIASCQFCGRRDAIDAIDLTMCCPSCRAKHGLQPTLIAPTSPKLSAAELTISSGNLPLTLRPTIFEPDHDGNSKTLRIVAPMIASQLETLVDWHRTRSPVRVDAGTEPYAIVGRSYTNNGAVPREVTLVLKQIRLDMMSVKQRAKMEQTAAPYAIGDEVRWRTGPCDFVWHLGRVTSIVDDRPNDGIDKPFWIVRVDTAGERCFSGPVIPTCLRREHPTGDNHPSTSVDVERARRDLLKLPGIDVRVRPGSRCVTAVYSGTENLTGRVVEMVERIAVSYPSLMISFEWTER